MSPLLLLIPILFALGGKKSSSSSATRVSNVFVRSGPVPAFQTPFDVSAGNAFRAGAPFASYAAIDAAIGKSNFGSTRPAFVEVEGGGKRYPTKEEAATGGTRKHLGRDIYFPPGTPIFAPEAGRITAKGQVHLHTTNMSGKTFTTPQGKVHRTDEELYGWAIALQVSRGNDYRFLHLDKASVTPKGVGDTVAAGEYLGRVVAAPTMASARAHLHLEAHKDTYDTNGKLLSRGPAIEPLGDAMINVHEFNILCGRGSQ